MYRVKDPDRLAYVIQLYCKSNGGRETAEAERQYFADLPSFEEVVRIAGGGEIRDGERHDHLGKIGTSALRSFRDRLLRCLPELLGCGTFDELYQVLWAKRAGGIAEVTVYDTTISIGSWWQPWLEPDVVYLHAGSAEGAYALGVPRGTARIRVEALPEEFHAFTAAQVEDILCEYYKYRSAGFAQARDRRLNR